MQCLLKWRAELSSLNILEQTFCCEVMDASAEGLERTLAGWYPECCPTWVLSCWWWPPQSWSSWPEEQVWHVRCSRHSWLGLLTSFRLWWGMHYRDLQTALLTQLPCLMKPFPVSWPSSLSLFLIPLLLPSKSPGPSNFSLSWLHPTGADGLCRQHKSGNGIKLPAEE